MSLRYLIHTLFNDDVVVTAVLTLTRKVVSHHLHYL